MESYILRTQERGKFPVTDLFKDGTVIISLPHRHSFYLHRIDKIIRLECDLGHQPDDLSVICEIDISKMNYQEAVKMDARFTSLARSFDNSFHLNKFVVGHVNGQLPNGAKILGEEWLDQIFVNLAEPSYKRYGNIEFSVIKANYIDFIESKEPLDEPAMTLVSSLQLFRKKAHYFLFVEWWSDNSWRYSKNFFYNNTAFGKEVKRKESEQEGLN